MASLRLDSVSLIPNADAHHVSSSRNVLAKLHKHRTEMNQMTAEPRGNPAMLNGGGRTEGGLEQNASLKREWKGEKYSTKTGSSTHQPTQGLLLLLFR